MKFTKTEIDGCYLITHKTFHDNRGYFGVPFNREEFNGGIGYQVNFVQDNMSYSYQNVIRGLHFQTGEFEQAKLVTCTYGRVFDVVVDIRKNSHTYGNVVRIELGLGLERQLFIPRGCAHGFSVLSEKAIFQYKVDNVYNKESEGGIIYRDTVLNINWGIERGKEIVSDKDLLLPTFLSI